MSSRNLLLCCSKVNNGCSSLLCEKCHWPNLIVWLGNFTQSLFFEFAVKSSRPGVRNPWHKCQAWQARNPWQTQLGVLPLPLPYPNCQQAAARYHHQHPEWQQLCSSTTSRLWDVKKLPLDKWKQKPGLAALEKVDSGLKPCFSSLQHCPAFD